MLIGVNREGFSVIVRIGQILLRQVLLLQIVERRPAAKFVKTLILRGNAARSEAS